MLKAVVTDSQSYSSALVVFSPIFVEKHIFPPDFAQHPEFTGNYITGTFDDFHFVREHVIPAKAGVTIGDN